MTTIRIIERNVNAPKPDETGQAGRSQKAADFVDLTTLRESLAAKKTLLGLLEKGGYISNSGDLKKIKEDVGQAIAYLDEIISKG